MNNWIGLRQAAMQQARAQAKARRVRAFGWFLFAGIFALFAQRFSAQAAGGFAGGAWYALASRVVYVLLLLVGFTAMGVLGQRQREPMASLGLSRRDGYRGEWLLGASIGWAGIVVCVLPVALTGGLLVTAGPLTLPAIGALIVDLLTLLVAALADELVFRGYPFQRLIEATGPVAATMVLTVLFALGHGAGLERTAGGVLSTLLLGFVLAMAYLRSKALWVGWGLHFAWNASMAVLFGLPVGGLTNYSPVISTYTSGPGWLSGGGYGPEGSAVAAVVLLGMLIVMARATRELRHRWALPEIVGAGIAVDVDAAARRHHEEAMGPVTPAGQALVQILPVQPMHVDSMRVEQAREAPKSVGPGGHEESDRRD